MHLFADFTKKMTCAVMVFKKAVFECLVLGTYSLLRPLDTALATSRFYLTQFVTSSRYSHGDMWS